MIFLEPKKDERLNWVITFNLSTLSKPYTRDIRLLNNSLTKKYEIVKEVLEDVNTNVKEFEQWYYKLFKGYVSSGYNSEILLENVDKCVSLMKKYVKSKNIDFSKFVDKSKASKTSVLFLENDIEAIAVATTCLKIYSPFFYDIELKVEENVYKNIYDTFVKECKDIGTIDKIFEIIRSRTFKSSVTDRYMWEMIKMTVLETPETNVLSVFNFFMRNLFILLNVDQNPVHFLIKVSDDNIRWAMSDIYVEKIVYNDEAVTSTEDVFGSSVSKETFNIYCCNDVILKCANFGIDVLKNDFNLTHEQFTSVCDSLEKIRYTDPYLKLFNSTIISKCLNIPYKYLMTSSPKHLILTSIFINKMLPESFFEMFPILSEFLTCFTKNTDSIIVKSSYRIRNIDAVLESTVPMFGIKCKKLKYDLLSPICGVLSANKRDLISICRGYEVPKMTYMDLEMDVIKYYEMLYSGKLDTLFKETEKAINDVF